MNQTLLPDAALMVCTAWAALRAKFELPQLQAVASDQSSLEVQQVLADMEIAIALVNQLLGAANLDERGVRKACAPEIAIASTEAACLCQSACGEHGHHSINATSHGVGASDAGDAGQRGSPN